ncbi:MAG: hypothetical protein DRI48_00715 [Chloroflexi bacterium]|nr:MAG: hypothetical protein DRI48_00715 [Chloroflexota bacterium]
MYRNVVVLLDGSELAERVLPHVTQVIRDRGSRVHLLSVLPLTKGIAPTVIDVHLPSVHVEQERAHVEQELTDYLRTVAGGLESVAADVQTAVRFGRPADEILAFVAEVDADLIAMSTHGRSGITRWVFGSVADRVLRGATCPVLLVQAAHAQLEAAYRRVLVPLDGSELAEQVIPYVKALIRPDRTFPLGEEREAFHVFLVTVLTTGLADHTVALMTSYPPGMQLATTALHQAEVQMRSYLRSVAAVLRERGAVVHVAVQQGAPADEILAYAAQIEADLISMTTHGFSGPSRWVYGNVAGKVLQGAHCPVLLVRPEFE